jgi:hypothetical protein
MRYDEPKEGEWVRPVKKGYRLCCCDCGLVHELDFKIEGKNILFKGKRNNRATAQVRRKLNGTS